MVLRYAFLLICLCVGSVAAPPHADGYITRSHHGFDVLVEEGPFLETHPQEMQAALEELDAQLLAITNSNVPPEALEHLREVKIFVDWATTQGGAQYHPSRQWLIDNGYEPEKERSVETSNALHFDQWSQQNQPWMALHELAHAYHHQVLGYAHEGVLSAYTHALDSGILDSVPYNPGNGAATFPREAYARTNEQEYFAEITEAYFGENDYYPFLRSELESYDPQGVAVLLSTWCVTNTAPHPGRDTFDVFPPSGRTCPSWRQRPRASRSSL